MMLQDCQLVFKHQVKYKCMEGLSAKETQQQLQKKPTSMTHPDKKKSFLFTENVWQTSWENHSWHIIEELLWHVEVT